MWLGDLAPSPVLRPWCSLGPCSSGFPGTGLKSKVRWPEGRGPGLAREEGGKADL